MSHEALVIMVFAAGVVSIIGHAIYSLRGASIEKKVREHMEEAREFAMLKQRHQTHLQQQQQQQMMAQQNMSAPWMNVGHTSTTKHLDVYERTQLALVQLQTLFLAGELEKQELLNATRMASSIDRENLVVVEEIIKAKLLG